MKKEVHVYTFDPASFFHTRNAAYRKGYLFEKDLSMNVDEYGNFQRLQERATGRGAWKNPLRCMGREGGQRFMVSAGRVSRTDMKPSGRRLGIRKQRRLLKKQGVLYP